MCNSIEKNSILDIQSIILQLVFNYCLHLMLYIYVDTLPSFFGFVLLFPTFSRYDLQNYEVHTYSASFRCADQSRRSFGMASKKVIIIRAGTSESIYYYGNELPS